ncbi:MAG: protease inhibitor I42 family protein [Clostridiales bacterium]|jgi:predicted secreted protein|nr:protease inhibitor I42 family protein [Clostridiales bacterium]
MKKKQIRRTVIIASVVVLILLAALTGCNAARNTGAKFPSGSIEVIADATAKPAAPPVTPGLTERIAIPALNTATPSPAPLMLQGTRLVSGATTELRVGDLATIVAVDKPSTGFLWTYEITAGGDAVEILSEDEETEDNEMVGDGGDIRTLYISLKAVKPGVTVIDMVKKRGEDALSGSEAQYTIIVT